MWRSNKQTDKTNAFADDTTACVRTDLQSINQLKNALTQFGNISGLKCNYEKTNIMAVGNRAHLTEEIKNIGFTSVDKIKLLGLEINFDLSSLNQVHETTIVRILSIIRFWNRLHISLPGRINIAKSLLLSQVNYLGCIIDPSPAQLSTISNIIADFIIGTLNISRKWLYLPPAGGGLGMINVSDFLTAQQAIWVKRAYLSKRDNWRADLNNLSKGNPLTLCRADVDQARHPILFNIAGSYEKFLAKFYSTNDNYGQSFLLNNPILRRGRDDN